MKIKSVAEANHLMRLVRTVAYLRIIQIYGRLKKALFHPVPFFYDGVKIGTVTRKILIPGLDLEEEYLSRFSPDELLNDEITLIGQKQSLRRGKWFYENQSPLWNYNLNYFEYGIALAARYRRTGEIQYKRKICCLIENWCETQRGGVGWHPYPISLRIPNWLIIYELLEEEPPQNVIDNL